MPNPENIFSNKNKNEAASKIDRKRGAKILNASLEANKNHELTEQERREQLLKRRAELLQKKAELQKQLQGQPNQKSFDEFSVRDAEVVDAGATEEAPVVTEEIPAATEETAATSETPNGETTETVETTEGATDNLENQTEETINDSVDKSPVKEAKNKGVTHIGITKLFAGVAGAVIAVGLATGIFAPDKKLATKATPGPIIPSGESQTIEMMNEESPYSGEYDNGLHYDYAEYVDYENKTSKTAFGYDKSKFFGDKDATADAWIEMASKAPEYLSSYASYVFTDEEKAELGIANMSSSELDNYLSNAENIDGGEKQQKIIEALDKIAHDKENTSYEFYYENGKEKTFYITFNDKNEDGICTPDEFTLCYAKTSRKNAPQVDVYRNINGKKVKVLDLNMNCGFQPNFEVPPEDLPEIPNPEPDPVEVITEKEEEESGDKDEPIEEETTEEDEDDENKTKVTTTTTHRSFRTTPTPTPTVAPKNEEKLIQIDEEIKEDIAEDINTEKVEITPTVDVTTVEEVTEKPVEEEYHEIEEPVIVENEEAKDAATITFEEESEEEKISSNTGISEDEENSPKTTTSGSSKSTKSKSSSSSSKRSSSNTTNKISSENNYTKNRDEGANANNATTTKVKSDETAQKKADENKISIKEAPSSKEVGGKEVKDILSGLGIS